MRKLAIGGGWALAVILAVALFFVLRPLGPPASFGDCPGAGPGTIFGNPGPTNVSDEIVNSPTAGNPLSLKLRYVAAPGVCVDGQSGNIHLYGNKTSGADFTVTFSPALVGLAAWPPDAGQAIQISDNQGGPYAPQPGAYYYFPPGSPPGSPPSELKFSIPYQNGRKPYFYHLQYTNPQGAPGNLQIVEPMIQNH